MLASISKFHRAAFMACVLLASSAMNSDFLGSRDSLAFAGNGNGNGNGNGGSNSNANGNSGNNGNSSANSVSAVKTTGQSKVASVKKSATKTQVIKVKVSNKLGALNAAHASAQAFAHASANSRIGKIKTYYVANVASWAAAEALTAANDANLLAQANLQTLVDSGYVAPATLADANTALESANAALVLSPDDATLIQAVTDAQTVVDAFTTAAALAEAQVNAVLLAAAATDALNAAANKAPVDDTTKAALDALLVGKIASE